MGVVFRVAIRSTPRCSGRRVATQSAVSPEARNVESGARDMTRLWAYRKVILEAPDGPTGEPERGASNL